MKKRRKFYALLMAVILCIAVLQPSIFAYADDNLADVNENNAGNVAKIGDVTYTTLKDAVATAVDGDTIVLLKDITTQQELTGGAAEAITVSGKSITIEGDGKAVFRNSDYLGTVLTVENGATLTMQNLTINGKTDWTWSYTLKTTSGYGYDNFDITISDETYVGTDSYIKNAGTLNFENVNAENIYAAQTFGALINSTGDLNLSNSSFTKILSSPYSYAGSNKGGGTINAKSGSVTLSNITVDNCGAGLKGVRQAGGFCAFEDVDLNVNNSTFTNTFATTNSGVFALSNMRSVVVANSNFDGCVVGNDGGVCQVNCKKNSISEFSFTNCNFDNLVGIAVYDQSLGAVMFVSEYPGYDAAPITFNSCKFNNNLCCTGVFADSDKVTVAFNDCEFENNKRSILFQRDSQITLNNCTATNNTADKGALSTMVSNGDIRLALYNTKVTGNKSEASGGAICMKAELDGCTSTCIVGAGTEITGNSTDLSGGAIFATMSRSFSYSHNTIIIEDGAKVCNNKAVIAADDIGVRVFGDNTVSIYLPDAATMGGKTLAEGAEINGWFIDSADSRFVRYQSAEYTDAVKQTVETTEALNLKAEVNGYMVNFDKNAADAVGEMGTQYIKIGTEKQLAENGFTRHNYTFSGWNTKADGTGTSYSNKALVKDLADTEGATVTLYAQWSRIGNTITIDWQDGDELHPNTKTTIDVLYGKTPGTITVPVERDKYVFRGIYSEPNGLGKLYVNSDGTWYRAWDGTEDTTLYAFWSSKDRDNYFWDVLGTDWFYDDVYFMYDRGLMLGLGNSTTFGSGDSLTRSQFVTILYRMAHSPAGVEYEDKFPDVPEGEWFTTPVMWAYSNGIVKGYGTGYFGPADAITREQLAVMLYNYVSWKGGFDITGRADLSGFEDADKVSDWAYDAVSWAVAEGIISGRGGTRLDPQGVTARCECSAMVQRYCDGAK